jgi:hypothetical protein
VQIGENQIGDAGPHPQTVQAGCQKRLIIGRKW